MNNFSTLTDQEKREYLELLRSQLNAVDKALGSWEPAFGKHCVDRVQAILNLKVDCKKLREESIRIATLLHFATHNANVTLQNCPRLSCINRRAALESRTRDP